jgi:hypothetical protein
MEKLIMAANRVNAVILIFPGGVQMRAEFLRARL